MRAYFIKYTWWLLFLLLVVGAFINSEVIAEKNNAVSWIPWSDTAFQRAKAEKKLVLLNLQAAWCHWCHVMDEETYSHPDVQRLLTQSFVTVSVQQDDNPALSARYRDSGWPATVIFDPNAVELEVLSGYVEAEKFLETLKRLVANSKIKNVRRDEQPDSGDLDSLSQALIERYKSSLDHSLGGLRTSHRYLDSDSVEYALRTGLRGGQEDNTWLHLTLEANRALQDPTWGGVYQYSTGRVWTKPHFEKLLSSQVASIYLYTLAHHADGGEHRYDGDVGKISAYMKNFLTSSQGSFYVSQAADVEGVANSPQYYLLGDSERRRIGVPQVDVHEYGRETSLGIEAMLYAYSATRKESFVADAIRAAEWLTRNRVLPDGSVLHDQGTARERYLADCIAAARALLRLYAVTGDKVWLQRGEKIVFYIIEHFKAQDGKGFVSSEGLSSSDRGISAVVRHVSLSENLLVGRVVNLYSYYTEKPEFRDAAEIAFGAVSKPKLALSSISEPGVLLLADELSRSPMHITVIGDRGDPRAETLWWEAIGIPDYYTQIERLSFSEVATATDSATQKIRVPEGE